MSEKLLIQQIATRQPSRVNIVDVERLRQAKTDKKNEVKNGDVDISQYQKLDTGEYIKKKDFEKLSEEDRKRLKELGFEGFANYYKKIKDDFDAAHVLLNTGEYIPKVEFDKLALGMQAALKRLGTNEFNRLTQNIEDNALEIKEKAPEIWSELEKSYVYIPKQEYLLPPSPEKSVRIEGAVGIVGTTSELKQVPREMLVARGGHIFPEDEKQKYNVIGTKSGFVSKEFWDSLDVTTRQILLERGIDNFNEWVKDRSTPHPKQGIVYIFSPSPSYYDMVVATPQGVGVMVGDVLYPLAGTQSTASMKSGDVAIPQSDYAKVVTVGNNLKITPSSRDEYVAAYIERYKELPPDQQLKQAGYQTDYDTKLMLSAPIRQQQTEATHEMHGGLWWSKEDWAKLPDDAKNAARESVRAYNDWVNSNYFRTQNNELVGISFYTQLSKEAQQIVDTGGVKALQDKQTKIINDLTPYKMDDGYDITRYLRDNSNASSNLKIAGFSSQVINNAEKFNEQPWVKPNQIDKFISKVKTETNNKYGDNILVSQNVADKFAVDYPNLYQEYYSLGRQYETEQISGIHSEAPMSINNFVADYLAIRGEKPRVAFDIIGELTDPPTEKQQALITAGVQEYTRLYGKSARVKEAAIEAAELTAGPAAGGFHPEGFKAVTAEDYITTALQVGLLASGGIAAGVSKLSPVAGKMATAALHLGAVGYFGKDIVKDWQHMNQTQQGLAVAINGLILWGGVSALKGMVQVANGKVAASKLEVARQTNIAKLKDSLGKVVDVPEVQPAFDKLIKGVELKDFKIVAEAGDDLKKVADKVSNPEVKSALKDIGSKIASEPQKIVDELPLPKPIETVQKFSQMSEAEFKALADKGKIVETSESIEIKLVAKGEKPAALISANNESLLNLVRENNLGIIKVHAFIEGGYNYLVFQPTSNVSMQAIKLYQDFARRYKLDSYKEPTTAAEGIALKKMYANNPMYHIELGNLLGYSDAEIAYFIEKIGKENGISGLKLIKNYVDEIEVATKKGVVAKPVAQKTAEFELRRIKSDVGEGFDIIDGDQKIGRITYGDTDLFSPNSITIGRIDISEIARRKGFATKAIDAVLSEAESKGKKLYTGMLEPEGVKFFEGLEKKGVIKLTKSNQLMLGDEITRGVADIKQKTVVTEGKIGRYGLYGVDTPENIALERAAIDAVASKGGKDVASITNKNLVKYAESNGLIVEAHPYGNDFWYARANTETAKIKLDKLFKLEKELKEGNYKNIELHKKIGELYGYSPEDIAAYIENQKSLKAKLRGVGDLLREIQQKQQEQLQQFKIDSFKGLTQIEVPNEAIITHSELVISKGFNDAYLNGVKVDAGATVPLNYGNVIRLGNKEIVFVAKEVSPESMAKAADDFDTAMIKKKLSDKILSIALPTIATAGVAKTWLDAKDEEKQNMAVLGAFMLGSLMIATKKAPRERFDVKLAPKPVRHVYRVLTRLEKIQLPPPKEIKEILKLSVDSGDYYKAYRKALTDLENTSPGSKNYLKAASDTQHAVNNMIQTDKKLFNKLAILNEITPDELRQIEINSRVVGLKQGVLDINNAMKQLNVAWNDVEAAQKLFNIKGDHTAYIRTLSRLEKAKRNVELATHNWGNNIEKSRYQLQNRVSNQVLIEDIENKLNKSVRYATEAIDDGVQTHIENLKKELKVNEDALNDLTSKFTAQSDELAQLKIAKLESEISRIENNLDIYKKIGNDKVASFLMEESFNLDNILKDYKNIVKKGGDIPLPKERVRGYLLKIGEMGDETIKTPLQEGKGYGTGGALSKEQYDAINALAKASRDKYEAATRAAREEARRESERLKQVVDEVRAKNQPKPTTPTVSKQMAFDMNTGETVQVDVKSEVITKPLKKTEQLAGVELTPISESEVIIEKPDVKVPKIKKDRIIEQKVSEIVQEDEISRSQRIRDFDKQGITEEIVRDLRLRESISDSDVIENIRENIGKTIDEYNNLIDNGITPSRLSSQLKDYINKWVRKDSAIKVALFGRLKPGIQVILASVTEPIASQIQAVEKAKTEARIAISTDIAAATKADVGTATSTQIQPSEVTKESLKTEIATTVKTATKIGTATRPATMAQEATKQETKPATKTSVITATKAPVGTRETPKEPTSKKPPPPPPPPIPNKEKFEYFRKHGIPEGSLAWKQGIIYRHWFPPYRSNKEHPEDWFFSKKPIPGVPYAEGVGSAYASIVRLGGQIPDELHYEMGLQNITIRRKLGSDKPEIIFELDKNDASWAPDKKVERAAKEESEKPKTIEVEGQKYVAVSKKTKSKPVEVKQEISQDVETEIVEQPIAEIKADKSEQKLIVQESKPIVSETSRQVELEQDDIFGGKDAFEIGGNALEVNSIDVEQDAFEVGKDAMEVGSIDVATETQQNIIPQWREESTVVQPVNKKPVQPVKKFKTQEGIRLIR